jgi:membrane protease YdiL (CAAX protease family)
VARDPSLKVPGSDILVVGGVVLVTYVLAGLAANALASKSAPDLIYRPVSMLLVICTYVAMAAAVFWAVRRTGDWRRALGLVRPDSWPKAIGLALLTVIAALAVSAALEPIFHGADAQGIAPDTSRPPGLSALIGVVLAYVAVAVVGPIVEELLFRGLLTAGFRQRFGPYRTAAITAAIFAASHFLPRVMPAIFLLGLALAFVYERFGSTMPGMLVHCVYNGIALTAAVTKH